MNLENIKEFKELANSQKDLVKKKGLEKLHIISETRKRNLFQRDYARVMYSSSFRRLQGKMQLMPVTPNKFNRNRLTHSLEVSQIARSIAEFIQQAAEEHSIGFDLYTRDSLYVVETGAFAHDIGNPPFGHHGEEVLNELMLGYGGFEGNAQSLRILMNIEKKNPNFAGLNLTLRALLSIVKYNIPYSPAAEKFVYRNEFNELNSKLESLNLMTTPRTLDVQIVDAADEIAYCAHDLEDALSQQYFSIEEFMFDLREDAKSNKYPYEEEVEIFEGWVHRAREVAKKASVYDSSEEYSFLFRKELTSIMVHELINDLDIISVTNLKEDFVEKTGTFRENELAFKNWKLVRGIKHCTFKAINRSNDIQIYEKLGTKVITGLFQALSDDSFNKGMLLMPVEYRSNNKEETETAKMRKIADYIGGMMDTYAIETYEKIFGKSDLNQLYDEGIYNTR